MKKIKFAFFMLASCIALAATFAFNLPSQDAKPFFTYHYELESTDFQDLRDPNNWQATGAPVDCGYTEASVPCSITYEGDFGEYLENLGSGPAIVAAADTWRQP